MSGTRLRNEFLPGQESRDPSEGGVPSPNESGVRPNIQMPLVWKVCPKPLPDPTLLECLAVNFRVRLSGRQERQRLQTREVARKMRR